MKKPVKFFLLFLALLLPALVYVFLRSFGRNEFEVPALFQDSVDVPGACSRYTFKAPYTVPDSLLSLGGSQPQPVTVFVLTDMDVATSLARLKEEFGNEGYVIVKVASGMRTDAACALLLQPPSSAAMVDGEGRIRGHYVLSDREDTDRLILEMKIMLKKY